ncbi:IS66 family transposase [methane-oxidizing endosymbiont of Gigantopelta aegis]|uniref:IS66 family transposase n=1 Tax=methane-oxidizing endosymbiont of Gigantopelta aegis TaxID=2794938 RepID=UPI00247A635A|nr:transposase [methane-oxidizing endosymbiont of Gigantopelta aegis]
MGEAVRAANLGYADETRHYRNRSTYWLWSLSTDQAAYFLTHYSRGKGAANALLGNFNGVLVTDRHGAYNDYAANKHQYCWAHIIRNLEKIAQRRGQAGKDGQKLLRLARLGYDAPNAGNKATIKASIIDSDWKSSVNASKPNWNRAHSSMEKPKPATAAANC